MRPLVRSVALALLLTPVLSAQPLHVGGALPLTDTRYGAFGGTLLLRSNGVDPVLFWTSTAGTKLRATRLVDGQKRAARPVLDVGLGFDAIWTGTHFLVVAYRVNAGRHTIVGRLVDGSGEAVGEEFTITERYGIPRLAHAGGKVLLTLGGDCCLNVMLLETDGRPATDLRVSNLLDYGTIDTATTTRGTGFIVATALLDGVKMFVLQANGDVQDAPALAAPKVERRKIAAATRGEESVVAWTNGDAPIEMVTIRANATIGARTIVPGTGGATSVDVTWTGSQWALAFMTATQVSSRLIDPSSGAVQTFPAVAADGLTRPRLVTVSGRTRLGWRGVTTGAPILVSDMETPSRGETAAFAAAEQELQTATSSHDAALVVWSETRDGRRTLHAGTRNMAGEWRESRIGSDEDAPVAASDGSGYLVALRSQSGWSALSLDRDLHVVASSSPITSFLPTDLIWGGTSYVAIGLTPAGNLAAAQISTTAVVKAPVLIKEKSGSRHLTEARIAAGGGGFLALWQDWEEIFCFPICDPYDSTIRATRLNADLQRVDELDLEIAPDQAEYPRVVWDGQKFVVFFAAEGISMRTVKPNAAGSAIVSLIGYHDSVAGLAATMLDGTIALTYGRGLGILVRDGAIAGEYVLGDFNAPDRVVALDGNAVYVQADVEDAMPYHGARRIFLRELSPLSSSVSSAPKIGRALFVNGLMELVWDRVPEPVDGYRLEYRVNDGTWNELDRWFDDDETSTSIRPWINGATYQFRVRAWSAAGLSAYSPAETVSPPRKRRSVR